MNIVLDIETNGLEIDTQINYVGMYYKNPEPIFESYRLPEDLEALKSSIAKKNAEGARWAYHNGKFDTVRLLYSYGINLPIHHDTMILAYLCSTVDELKENRGKWLGLKYVAPRILGVDNWDIGTSKKTSKTDADVLPYLEKDCQYTYELLEYFLKNLPKSRIKTYHLIIEACNAYKMAEINGLPIDIEQLHKTKDDYLKEEKEVDAELKKFADINYNSSKQLSKLLFNDLNLPVISITKGGVPSTGVTELKELSGQHPIIDLILKKRNIEKALAFLESWDKVKVLHKDGSYRVHSNFNMHGTVTGRTSSSDVNLQQIPRNKKLKSLFKSTVKGWQLVCLDYSQLELRFAGLVANVPAIKDAYRQGIDLHTQMAALIAGKDKSEVTKEERTRAKAANFGYLYGMSASSFVTYAKASYGVTITQEEAEHIRDNFFASYPELLDYYDRVRFDMLNSCMQTSIMGREYEINPWKLENPYTRENWLRPAINFPVQSAGSDYVICGLIEVSNTPGLKDNVKVCATVHDSIIALVREDDGKFAERVKQIKNIMEHPKLAEQLIQVNVDMPIVVDVEIGPLGKGVDLEEYLKEKEENNG